MAPTHHCRKCNKVASTRCFKTCGLQTCHLHPSHIFSEGSWCRACRACQDPREVVVEREPEIGSEDGEIDVLPEEWVGFEQQAREWRLMEQMKAQRARERNPGEVSPNKVVESDSAGRAVKGKQRTRGK